MIILPELIDENLQISQVTVANEITITLRTTSPTAACPCCGTISKRVQSRYRRTLHDLPMSGRLVHLMIEVRRFFCKKSTCAQKIFAEQLPALCRPHAQRTKRLQEALCRLGLAVGGQAGEDIGSEQGLSGSRDTILRLVRKFELPAAQEPRVIGLDDWAWKRRHHYGTLICDLEQNRPIDLLPDRRAETVSAWLQGHPHIDIVSRDGSSEYASAISKGAPQARQVSDRWHLVKNLAACVSVQLAQSLAQIRRAEQAKAKASAEEKPRSSEQPPARTRAIQQAQHARQAERRARDEQMMMLREQGLKSADIAAQVGMAERTMRGWLSRGDLPYSGPRRERARLIDPYKTYLLSRWHQGCRTGSQLERELRAKGYKGSGRAMYRYLATLEPSVSKRGSSRATRETTMQPNPLLALSAQQTTWLFFRKQDDLTKEEQESLRQLRQASPHIETAYRLVEKFLQMVRERTGEQLDGWLAFVEASHLKAFDSFVTGVQQDKEAVFAGLTLPWSNGPLEGNVNRLKLIKRSMYGRAEFDLLKLRVLHRSKKNQDRKDKKKNHQEQQVGRLKKPKMMKNRTTSQHITTGISEVA
ncbi:MAG: ISL3 family transposase [Chloroflexi bacterium]|nr:MAG: ISL3 family transposase [Chloroflexota bacterium]